MIFFFYCIRRLRCRLQFNENATRWDIRSHRKRNICPERERKMWRRKNIVRINIWGKSRRIYICNNRRWARKNECMCVCVLSLSVVNCCFTLRFRKIERKILLKKIRLYLLAVIAAAVSAAATMLFYRGNVQINVGTFAACRPFPSLYRFSFSQVSFRIDFPIITFYQYLDIRDSLIVSFFLFLPLTYHSSLRQFCNVRNVSLTCLVRHQRTVYNLELAKCFTAPRNTHTHSICVTEYGWMDRWRKYTKWKSAKLIVGLDLWLCASRNYNVSRQWHRRKRIHALDGSFVIKIRTWTIPLQLSEGLIKN